MPKQEQLKPMEIAKRGLIRNSTGGVNINSNYIFILNLIKAGILKAKDYCTTSGTHYWLVSMEEIERYNNQVNN